MPATAPCACRCNRRCWPGYRCSLLDAAHPPLWLSTPGGGRLRATAAHQVAGRCYTAHIRMPVAGAC
eukprot:7535162-Alexandrium_andersonii.AAC.1